MVAMVTQKSAPCHDLKIFILGFLQLLLLCLDSLLFAGIKLDMFNLHEALSINSCNGPL